MSLRVRFLFTIAFLIFCNQSWAFDQFERFSENGKFGLINTETQEVVLQAEYESVGWSTNEFKVYEGTIAVKRNNKWALASVEGEMLTQPLYTILYPFVDGLLVAAERSRFSILSQYGLINTKGKTTLPLEYDRLEPNEKQLIASILTQGRYLYGLLSKSGKEIIPIDYPGLSPVKEGLYAVSNEESLSALFSEEGRQLSPFEFESIENFDPQRLLVRYYNRKGLVDQLGKVIIPPVYKDIRLENGKIRALPFKKWRLWSGSDTGREFFFDQMLPLGSNRFAVQANQNMGIIDGNEAYIAYYPELELVEATCEVLVVSNGQYQGVVNREGKMIMPVNYDDIEITAEAIFGEIKRKDGQNWEVFDHKGKAISRQRYASFHKLGNGLFKALKNEKYGLINAEGKEQSPFVYDAIGNFKNRMAVVHYLGNEGVIHENGNWAVTPYKDSLVIYEDYILYKNGSEHGLLDYDEKVLFRTQKKLVPLNRDLILSHDEDGFQVMNKRGQLLNETVFDTVQLVHDGLLAVVRGEKTQLFRPSSGQMIDLPMNTKSIGQYGEDLISARIDGQWGFVKEDGSLSVANRYEAVNVFSEGLSAVKLIGKWGVINKQENIIIQPSYDRIGTFYGGLAVTQRGKDFGLIDRQGTKVLDLQYQRLEVYDEYILLESGKVWGLADHRGNLVRTPQYDRIEPLENGAFLVQKNGKTGVINLDGEDLVPLAYEMVLPFTQGFLAGEPSTWITPRIK